ncbi:molybdopterin cofactor-binding domain-containing protein [Bosea sp. NPDC055332]
MTMIVPEAALGRRDLLKLAGGLVVAVAMPMHAGARPVAGAVGFAPNAFIRIDRRGLVTLVMPMAEMGQGIHTALSMLLAEELEIGLETVRLEQAPADDALYGNAVLGGVQSTGNSASIRAFWQPLRQAGATARGLLIAAAAGRWQVEPATLRAENGAVVEQGGGRRVHYGDLVEAAAELPLSVAAASAPKQRSSYRLIGKPLRRIEGAAKVDGSAVFGLDVRLPGLRVAAIAISPVLGGKPSGLDRAAALAVKDVSQVVVTDEAVAVVAAHTGAAYKGLEAAVVRWDDGVNGDVDSAMLVRELEQASRQPGAVARSEGDAGVALASAARRLDAVYEVPFLAHTAMEPMNCTVEVRKERCDIWVGTQVPTIAQAVAAAITGLPKSAVHIHNQLLGGSFGRRLEVDGIALAVKIARQVEGPVKVIWSRSEDVRHDMYRPYYYDRISAGLDAGGRPTAWTHRIAGSSILSRYFPPAVKNGVDPDAVEGAADMMYGVPNLLVDYVRVEPRGVPTSWWRGVGATHNVFVVESFIDELAAAAGADSLAYRRQLIPDPHTRARAVLDLAAAKAGWGAALPAHRGRGIAVQFAFGSYVAMVAEVEVAAEGAVKVRRLICAVDCGIAINPDTIAAQIEGGAVYGLTAALHGAITFRNGRVEQGNFDDYPALRIDEVPRVETHLIDSAAAPGGIGEVATAIVAPAVTNAIFAATGKRIRKLPIDAALLRAGR